MASLLLAMPAPIAAPSAFAAEKTASKTPAKKTAAKKKAEARPAAKKDIKSRTIVRTKPPAKPVAIKRGAQKAKAKARASGPVARVLDGKYAAVVVDASAGRILYEKNAEAIRHPASLTKMMTLYLLFDALKKGKLNENDTIVFSNKAASQPATNIFSKPGDRIPVKTAIQALVVRSANDVAMAVAEKLGGTEFNFALMMNKKARELGMNKTVYYNPSGLPDARQVTTAIDLAKLSIALRRDFPDYYDYFQTRSFSHAGRTYETHNRVVLNYKGADGLKTGYIRDSGFNLATSASRGNDRLVGVVMGGSSASLRDAEMMDMLDRTFADLAAKRRTASTPPAAAPPQARNATDDRSEAVGAAPAKPGDYSALAPSGQGG